MTSHLIVFFSDQLDTEHSLNIVTNRRTQGGFLWDFFYSFFLPPHYKKNKETFIVIVTNGALSRVVKKLSLILGLFPNNEDSLC